MAQAYADAAGDAKRLGFDCIELHGAHAYLIDEFFWERTNQRTDRFGGSIEKRAEFAAETIRRCRVAVGDLPIIIRISQWKSVDYAAKVALTPQELERWVRVLVDAGVDAIHCSQRRILQAEFPDIDGPNGLNLAGWVKKLSGLPTISVGSVGLSARNSRVRSAAKDQRRASSTKRSSGWTEASSISSRSGRALLQDPEWAVQGKATALRRAARLRRDRAANVLLADRDSGALVYARRGAALVGPAGRCLRAVVADRRAYRLVLRKPALRRVQCGQGRFELTRGVQPNRMHIGIVAVARRELGRSRELDHAGAQVFLAHEQKAEREMNVRRLGVKRGRPAQ